MDKAVKLAIETQLRGPYGSIKLRADGYRITAEVRRVSTKAMRYGVVLFVDGWLKGEHLKADSEIGAKFYPLRTRNLLREKDYQAHRKVFGKRAADDFKKRSQYQYRDASFRSGKALCAHLKRTCKIVEIAE